MIWAASLPSNNLAEAHGLWLLSFLGKLSPMTGKEERAMLHRLERKLDEVIGNLEKSRFLEYVEYMQDRKRILRNSFLLGIARGVGSVIGFTILGAILWSILKSVAESSIPLLGEFISEIVHFVESRG